MNREHLAGRRATDVNAPWTLDHVTDSDGVDEYQLTIGHTTLTFDPREQTDRAQMREIIEALDSALTRETLEALARWKS
jgi:hypothetical protein